MARRLSQSATDFLRQKTAFDKDPEGFVADWRWDDDQKTIALRRVTPEQAATRTGSRHAARALEVSPGDPRARVLGLAFGLARETRLNTIFQPLPAGEGTTAGEARAAGPAVLNEVLREALTAKRPEIAATAARLLGELKDPVALVQSGERTAPLMMALDHPDIRVQFAATQAILKIGPKIPYRGGRRVVEVLKQAVHSNTGRPHAIIGEVSSERAGEISGMLKELGFETLVALSGKEVFRAAADRTDVELILVHPNIIRWPLSETLSNLRTDARTARVPVVVYGPSRLQERFRSPAPGQTKVTYATLSETPADLAFQIQPVLDQMRREAPTAQQQTLMRKEAIAALSQLADTGNSRLYNLVGTEEALAWAAAEPSFSLSALESLGRIGTRQAQNLIAEFILNSPVNATTKRAREILDAHVARNGLLLKQSVVSELHAGTGVTLINPEP
ncbi:MAG: hypothetical protein NT069_19315 [Planctomycetota bacterium]|nr:hypothetical protein [Planctomycetota bacterium]